MAFRWDVLAVRPELYYSGDTSLSLSLLLPPFHILSLFMLDFLLTQLVLRRRRPSGVWVCTRFLPTGEFFPGHCYTSLAYWVFPLTVQSVETPASEVI